MKRTFTLSRAQEIGHALGIDFSEVNAEEFRMGLAVEMEHGTADPLTDVTQDDLMLTGKIAWAHLREFPDYYTRLAKLEAEADQYWTARR